MNISKKQTKRKTEYFDPSRSHTCKALGDKIIEMIYEMDGASKDIIVICIGTDRATGDALGPLVGDYILAHNTTYQVAGTLQYPVHALNINIFQFLIKWSELQNLRYMILSALYWWHLHIIAKHSLKKYIIILRDFTHYFFKWLFNQWEQVI